MSETEGQASADLPEGDYAIVELFGHVKLVGRIAEVERFGTKMLQVEALFAGKLLPAQLYGGGAIYGLTVCSPEVALRNQPRSDWQLPASLRVVVPAAQLAAPDVEATDLDTDLDPELVEDREADAAE